MGATATHPGADHAPDAELRHAPLTPRFELVDSVRGLGALMIFGYHAMNFGGGLKSDSFIRPFVIRLDAAIPIFFLISAFLLYQPFLRARMGSRRPLKATFFAWRRFLRIVPGYWVALALTVPILGMSGVLTAGGIPRYFGFAQIYSQQTFSGGLPQAWTLCIEVTFYAFLPLFAYAVRRASPAPGGGWMRAEAIALGGLALAGIAYKLILLAADSTHQAFQVSGIAYLPAYFDQFAIGMSLAVMAVWLERRPQVPRVLRPVQRWPLLPWALAAVLLLGVTNALDLQGFGEVGDMSGAQYMARHELYGIAAALILLPAIVGPYDRGVLRRVLGSRPLLLIGTIGYGFYLWHQTVLRALFKHGFGAHTFIHPYVSWVLVGFVLTFALALASWYLVERPALRLKYLFSPRERPDAAVKPPMTAPAQIG